MKASWKKMMNYAASFARDFDEYRQKFPTLNIAPDDLGYSWSFARWMLLKVGPSEKTALQILGILAERARIGNQETHRERLAEIKRDKKVELQRIKAEKAERKAAREAAREAAKIAEQIAKAEKQRIADAEKKATARAADKNRNERWRRKQIAEHGIAELQAILATGRLPISTCERIANLPPEAQPKAIQEALGNPHVRPYPERQRPRPAPPRPPTPRDRLECPKCHATTAVKCDCGVAYVYVSAGKRAAEAVAANPEKSDRAIAAEIGVSHPTVSKARREATGKDLPSRDAEGIC
jgi:hypothetical protein